MQKELSYNLKKLRKNNKFMQKDVAKILGISVSQMQKYEYGTREPDIDKLIVLADLYHVSLDELVGREADIKQMDFGQGKLIDDYRKLNDFGKEEANKRVRELTEVPKYVQSQTVKVACRGAGIQEIGLDIIKKLIQDAEKNKDKNIDDLF